MMLDQSSRGPFLVRQPFLVRDACGRPSVQTGVAASSSCRLLRSPLPLFGSVICCRLDALRLGLLNAVRAAGGLSMQPLPFVSASKLP
jgi:hypothetical protein